MSEKGTMKGHTIKGGHKRPTKKGAGMTAKGVAKYRNCLLYTSPSPRDS